MEYFNFLAASGGELTPEGLEEIPAEAELIILPTDDSELYEYNKKTADKMMSKGKKVVCVKMKKPEIPVPELELMSATP
jgi:hypothetical protein